MDLDYLQEAKRNIQRAQSVDIDGAGAHRGCSELATACALVAQTELLVALVERLDTIIDGDNGGGKSLYVITGAR